MADIFRRHGEAWRRDSVGHVSCAQLRVMSAIEACRTAALGGHVERCEDCAHTRIAYNSCRNRHCPKCQWAAAAQWLAAREAELLPVPYYHVVFTLPAQIGAIAYQNKAKVYGLLFTAAAETLITIAADPKHLGAKFGLTAVLHTWGQNLDHHPHVHCVVPGGGICPDGKRWVGCRSGFFLPVRVLSRLFRRLFLEGLVAAFKARELQFFSDLAGLKDPDAFAAYLAPLRKSEWVIYAKRPFAGPVPGPRLPRALHSPRRHRQQSAGLAVCRQCQLSLEGLSPGRQGQNDDASSWRVHPALSDAHPAGRLPPHPALWSVCKRPPCRHVEPLSSTSRHAILQHCSQQQRRR
ncbi:hypothetical protein V1289_004605 [Bradyrhizobium sp. AZCC 2289]